FLLPNNSNYGDKTLITKAGSLALFVEKSSSGLRLNIGLFNDLNKRDLNEGCAIAVKAGVGIFATILIGIVAYYFGAAIVSAVTSVLMTWWGTLIEEKLITSVSAIFWTAAANLVVAFVDSMVRTICAKPE
ncbi:8610_t:CDS:1, partial [Scutellospora calospora]